MGDWTPPEKRFSQLGQRLMTAALLIPTGLFVVWSGGWWLAVACALAAGIMAWEWGGMSGHPRRLLLSASAALFCLALPLEQVEISLALSVLGLVMAFASQPGQFRDRGLASGGWLYVTAMAAALWMLREGPWDGRAVALYFMAFVWGSDAAAYFVGRGMGGPRLLPHESPNKTWSGAVGALLFTGVCGFAAADLEQASAVVWVLLGVGLSMTAQAGDLFESGLKRRFKVKDSSNLLPGHGGVLDRVDGLGAVSVVGVLVLWLFPSVHRALGVS
ncbi:MAG: phosphatidate cytidylyltransferase [Pseudomonadota bacterium]|nr:phosphatidate cytidylyltransferase [Pseudomonadota bacterium]